MQEEFHIPGAINIPIFEDEEKRQIGLVYRREGVEKVQGRRTRGCQR